MSRAGASGDMGFRYPHYEAEFLLVAVGIALVAAFVVPIAQRLPSWIGIPLASVPLVLLVVACVVFWFRTRR